MKKLIDLKNVNKSYRNGDQELQVLKDIHLAVEEGEFVAIMGPSGSGKSTLMNIIGLLDRPTSGEYYLEGEEVAKLGEKKLAKVRNQQIGFVFQQLFLLSKLNALQNVELPLIYAGVSQFKRKALAEQYLKKVELEARMHHLPSELSGGQKQRFAIASTLVNNPKVLFLDEPTTGLDPQARRNLWDLIKEIRDEGITILLTTHYMDEAELLCDRLAIMDSGKIITIDTPHNLIQQLLSRGFKKEQVVEQANLEDVFIDLTGKAIRD